MNTPDTVYRFEVSYECVNSKGETFLGHTLVTAKRPNLGLTGAQERLKNRFPNSRSIKALAIRPYLSGSDLVKQRRRDRENVVRQQHYEQYPVWFK